MIKIRLKSASNTLLISCKVCKVSLSSYYPNWYFCRNPQGINLIPDMMIQLTGLSGSGKTTLANKMKLLFSGQYLQIEVIDGDEYRQTRCSDLGFSKDDRIENIRRLGKVASAIMTRQKLPIISAINPFEVTRMELRNNYGARIVWIKCAVETLIHRDTKGLYKRALLTDDHPDKIHNLTGVNDVYEWPVSADLIINTGMETIAQSTARLYQFILDMNSGINSDTL